MIFQKVTQIFEEPRPYPENMTEPEHDNHGFIGGTKVTNWENAELTMLLNRLKRDTLPQALKDGYLKLFLFDVSDFLKMRDFGENEFETNLLQTFL